MTDAGNVRLPAQGVVLRNAISDPVLRVVVTGAESTGKTTLARRLAEHYETVWVPEYVRTFVEEKGAAPVYEDVETIVRRHLALEDELVPQANRILICDTNLLSTCLYSRYYFNDCPGWIEQALLDRPYGLYLLAHDDMPWAPDPGQRDGPEVRALLQRRFAEALRERRLPHVHLRGVLEDRLRTATGAIDALLEDGIDRPAELR